MKRFIIGILVVGSFSAIACPDKKVCVGDVTIPDSYVRGFGIVQSINTSTGLTIIKGD